MIDYYLKFTSEAQAASVLEAYEGSIDTIGIIYERTGGTNDEPVMKALPGWHVNVRGSENELLAPFMLQVSTPYRVWA